MKKTLKTLTFSVSMIMVFSFILLASAIALSKEQTEIKDYYSEDFVDGSIFERSKNDPTPQGELKDKFSIYDHEGSFTDENGKETRTIRLFSKEQSEELIKKEENKELFTLSYDDVLFIIDDSIQKYRKYDKVILTNTDLTDLRYLVSTSSNDYVIDSYHGDFSELPYFSAIDQYQFMINDIYRMIIYRISLLDSSYFVYGGTPDDMIVSAEQYKKRLETKDYRTMYFDAGLKVKSFADHENVDSAYRKAFEDISLYVRENVADTGFYRGYRLAYYAEGPDIRELDAPVLYSIDNSRIGVLEKDGKTFTGLFPTSELEAIKPTDKIERFAINSKETAYHKMLNTIDYFDTAEGHFICKWGEDEYDITFATDMINNTAYQRFIDNKGNDVETYLTEGVFTKYNNVEKTARVLPANAVKKEDAAPLADDKRLTNDGPDGGLTMNCRADPTNISQSCISLFPQEMAALIFKDFDKWTVNEWDKSYCGRSCKVVEGECDYRGIKHITLYVDSQTGVWLYGLGTDCNGHTVYSLETDRFSADHKVEIEFDADKYANYRR